MKKKKNTFSLNAELIVNQIVGDANILAEKFGVTIQTVRNWINGNPTIPFLRFLEEKTGHNLHTLYEVPLNLSTVMKTGTNDSLILKEPDSPKYETRLDKLINVIEQLTMQVNELPELRERIALLEKELHKIKANKSS